MSFFECLTHLGLAGMESGLGWGADWDGERIETENGCGWRTMRRELLGKDIE